MNKRNQRRGFTLIEVTLAIVVGIIMIAGATLIYNQARNSAGNSRAQAKAASLQSLVEQYIARADGLAPPTFALRAMWERARPDDFNKSPWGGLCTPCDGNPQLETQASPACDGTSGYIGAGADAIRNPGACGAATEKTKGILDGLALTPDRDALTSGVVTGATLPANNGLHGPTKDGSDPSFAGGTADAGGVLLYYRWPSGRPYAVWDESRRQLSASKQYAIASTDSVGRRWFYVRGNQAGIEDIAGQDVAGQIGGP